VLGVNAMTPGADVDKKMVLQFKFNESDDHHSVVVLSSISFRDISHLSVDEKYSHTKAILTKYLDVVLNGGSAASITQLNEDDIDGTLDLLRSAHYLTPIQPRTEDSPIRHMCSCSKFWHYYKCKHSLALAIAMGQVHIPTLYNTKSFSRARCGRKKKAKGGDALRKEMIEKISGL